MRGLVSRKALALLLFACLGCKEELRSGLDREEATRIEWLLRQQGIQGEVVERSGGWSVRVPQKDERSAVVLLSKNPVRARSLETESRSLIPTRGEELRLRESRSATRIKEVVEGIPGVVESRVLLSLGGTRGEGGLSSHGAATASIYVLLNDGVELSEEELKKLVAGGTGIQPGNIFVVMKILPPLLATEEPSKPEQTPSPQALLGVGAGLCCTLLILSLRRGSGVPERVKRLRPHGGG